MVRLKGPLSANSASGTLGGQLTFSEWNGRAYARQCVTPDNPQTPAQTSTRSLMAALGRLWFYLSDDEKVLWEPLAQLTRVSTFNAYTAYNLDRWASYLPLLGAPEYTIPTPLNPPTITIDVIPRRATLTFATDPIGGDVFYYIFRSTAPGFLAVKHDIIAIHLIEANPIVYIDDRLDPGTYYYRARSIDYYGNQSTDSDICPATVP